MKLQDLQLSFWKIALISFLLILIYLQIRQEDILKLQVIISNSLEKVQRIMSLELHIHLEHDSFSYFKYRSKKLFLL